MSWGFRAFVCTGRKQLGFCSDSVYGFLGKWTTKHPILVLVASLTIPFVLTWLGLQWAGYPQFQDPYLGFQTRFTPISNRLTTLENFRRELNALNLIENYPGEKRTEKEWRRRRRRETSAGIDIVGQEGQDVTTTDDGEGPVYSNSNYCPSFPLEDYSRIALKLDTSNAGIFSEEIISLICYFQKMVEEIPSYSSVCELDSDGQCCSLWSLPNYVAQWANRSDCAHVTKEDILMMEVEVKACVDLNVNETMVEECGFRRSSCPRMCHTGEIIPTALLNTVDKSYLHSQDPKYSMLIIPVAKSSLGVETMENLQTSLQNLQISNSLVSFTGVDFGGKEDIFKSHLVGDLRYVAVASVFIFFIVVSYTLSVFVSAVSFLALTLSVGVTYYLYTSVFAIPYFPFMNMLVSIIILGIGTDGTLILSASWQRWKKMQMDSPSGDESEHQDFVLTAVLKESTATLLITTCTTAAAFFASYMSSITTIKCFSLFAGIGILVSFLLIYISVPSALVTAEWGWTTFRSLFPTHSDLDSNPPKLFKFIAKIQAMQRVAVSRATSTLKTKLGWFPIQAKTRALRLTSFLCFSAILIWACVVVLYSPGFQLPTSEQFQLLTASHPMEIFDSQILPHFSHGNSVGGESTDLDLMTLYFIWGLKSVDSGNGLDPLDSGHLEFDSSFTLSSEQNQKWLRRLCRRMRKETFYDPVSNGSPGSKLDGCFLDTMVSWMKRDCGDYLRLRRNVSNAPCCKTSKFPYKSSVFDNCVGLAARDVYRTPSFYFRGDLAGPKFHTLPLDGGNNTTPKMATFTIRIKTNVPFSFVHSKMAGFYSSVETFSNEIMRSAPPGLENGFFISSHFDFMDLQTSLTSDTPYSVLLSLFLCFALMWMATRCLSVAIGACLVILATVGVSSGILIQGWGWRLGVFESIALTVAVGLSDFTAHHSLEYSESSSVNRMISPTLTSAICTVTMGLGLVGWSHVLVYQQIGSFFVVLVLTSWFYSVAFLPPLLFGLGKVGDMLGSIGRRVWACACAYPQAGLPKDSTSIVDDECNSTSEVGSEPVTNGRKSVEAGGSKAMMEEWQLLKKVAQETTV